MDKYFNEVIDIAIKHAGRSVLCDASCETAVPADIKFSEAFEKRMKRLIKSDIRKKRTVKIIKSSLKVAAILALLVILSTSVIFSTEALRVKVLNMFIEKGEGQVDLQFYEVNEDGLPTGMIVPDYMPDGFTRKNAYKNGPLFISEYQNGAGNAITIHQGFYLGNVTVDDDNMGSYGTEIMGKKAYVAINKTINSVYFNSNAYGFIIYGDIDPDELIKIAKNIIEKDQKN